MARPTRFHVARRVTSDLHIEPSRDDAPARLIATVVAQDKDGNTLGSDTLNIVATGNECPPAVRQAIGTIEGFVKAWGEDG